jgi:F-type H+-transporting ATPase subunit b
LLSNLTALPLLAGGLTDIEWMLTLSTLILFTLFVFVLSKFAWGPLLSAIDEREKSIREAIESSRKQNAEAAALLAQHKELVREIGAEREEIIKKATKEAEDFRIDLMAKRESAVALAKLREEVADLAILGASKIVASSMTPEAQKKLVTEFVGSLPKVKN